MDRLVVQDAELLRQLRELETAKLALESSIARSRHELYRPANEKILAFHQSKAKIRLICGSNRSSKTTSGIAEAIFYALGTRPFDQSRASDPPTKILIVAQDFTNAVIQTIHPKLMSMIPDGALMETPLGIRYMHSGIPTSYHFKNGSFIKLGSSEQEMVKFEGSDWDLVVFDETPRREIYIACLRGTIDRGGRIVFAMTPESSLATWVYDDIYTQAGSNPDIFQVTVSIYENPYLGKEEIEFFKASLTPEEQEARIYGRFKTLIGRVYPQYDPSIHCIDPQDILSRKNEKGISIFDTYPKGLAIDPADRKPFAMLWFALSPQEEIIIYREWPETDFFRTAPLGSIEDYAELIRSIEKETPGGSDTIHWRLMDPNYGIARSVISNSSIVNAFKNYELFFDTDINDDLHEGHHAVRSRLTYDKSKPISELNRPKLYFFKGLNNLHHALTRYIWDTRRMEEERGVTERVKEKVKDFVDPLRYICAKDLIYLDPLNMEQNQYKATQRILSSRIGLR